MSSPSAEARIRGYSYALGVLAMAFVLTGCGMKVCLFSAVKGAVTRDGAPVANAEIERTYKWGWMNQTDSDKTRSDAQGRFSFDAAWSHSLLHGVLPLQPTIVQTITIRSNGQEYRAWSAAKYNFDDLGEIGRPLELTCELTAPDTNRKTHWGIGQLPPGATPEEEEDEP
jgi:hypothetical protein